MPIKFIQLDPNGLCNAGCWFCPIAYQGNPKQKISTMPVELLEKIFIDITDQRDKGLITAEFLYFSHYNEIFIYRHFEEMLKLMRKYNWTGMFLSNGTTMSKKITDMLVEYKDVYAGLCINSPCYTEHRFEARTGMKVRMLNKLKTNIRYAIDSGIKFSMVINGINDKSGVVKGPEFPNVDNEELEHEVITAKWLFPEITVQGQPHLIDRAGLLDHVITNNYNKEGTVIGCHGNREYEWLHINALGEVFICCNDFDMEYVFGDFRTQNIKDFWLKESHNEQIKKAYEGICSSCSSAKR